MLAVPTANTFSRYQNRVGNNKDLKRQQQND